MNTLKVRKENRKVIDKFKSSCVICGETEKCCLEIHYRYDKHFTISRAVTNKSTKEIKKELKYCVCLCSNCHRKLHKGLINIK